MLFQKQNLTRKLNTLDKELRKLKATIHTHKLNEEAQHLTPDKDSHNNFKHHMKRFNEEIEDALQHLHLASIIIRGRDDN